MTKIYVDGCSYVYGQGLDRSYSLGALLGATIDNSRSGKSNIAISEDLYDAVKQDYDWYVVGYTFSNRYSFSLDRKPIDMYSSSDEYVLEFEQDEIKLKQLHQLYYYFSDIKKLDQRSDYLVDSSIALLEQQHKKFVMFSWEPRTIMNSNKIFYPRHLIAKTHCQSPTNHHLNQSGMQILANIIRSKM
jgi:hypothetical protein